MLRTPVAGPAQQAKTCVSAAERSRTVRALLGGVRTARSLRQGGQGRTAPHGRHGAHLPTLVVQLALLGVVTSLGVDEQRQRG